jgi:hypothetical protein
MRPRIGVTHDVREGQVLDQRIAREDVPLSRVGVFAVCENEFDPTGGDLIHWRDAETKHYDFIVRVGLVESLKYRVGAALFNHDGTAGLRGVHRDAKRAVLLKRETEAKVVFSKSTVNES